MVDIGQKWTRKSRMAPGNNTIRIVGIDPDCLCIQYIRHNGPLELIPRGRFLRHFKKGEEVSLIDFGHLKECDIFNSSDGNECTCKG